VFAFSGYFTAREFPVLSDRSMYYLLSMLLFSRVYENRLTLFFFSPFKTITGTD